VVAVTPKYRTFEQLERTLGEGWTKGETEAPVGACVILGRTWACGCHWSQSLSVMGPKSRLEFLFPCPSHASVGFRAEFRDETWRQTSAMYDLQRTRRGRVVTPDMLPHLTGGQLLRVRSSECAEANPDDPLIGTCLFEVLEGVSDGDSVHVRSTSGGMIETSGQLASDVLDRFEVRLVSRGDERWPQGPTWVLKKLESQAPHEADSSPKG
jgi:hypothetical protein